MWLVRRYETNYLRNAGLSLFMKRLLCLFIIALTCSFAAADQFGQRQVSVHPLTGTGTIKHGCRYVLFDLVGFSGSIGNVTFSSITKLLPIPAQSQDTLGDIPYTVTGGTLNVIEER
jgi:hypothetical protein